MPRRVTKPSVTTESAGQAHAAPRPSASTLTSIAAEAGVSLSTVSKVLNGRTDNGSGEDQGFSTALANGGIDPINVFPVGPDNDNPAPTNNYSPLWDAHVSMWTDKAISAHKVHRIHSMDEQKELIAEGYLTSASISPPGPSNAYVGGLRPTQAIINCPVIAHPELAPQ